MNVNTVTVPGSETMGFVCVPAVKLMFANCAEHH